MIQQAIQHLVEGKDLTDAEVGGCVKEMVDRTATQSQVGAFLAAIAEKGETPDEIAAFASALRAYSLHIRPSVNGRLVDTCGTGGDKVKTFNVSTISALVTASAGATVAKHGNRSVTGRCGSADLLERLGFNVAVQPDKVCESIEHLGIGFMFAPTFHPAMKAVAPIRKELGIRTIFNVMGPLLNPALADAQVLGVYSKDLVKPMAQVLGRLDSKEAMVVHALEGMDEISVSGRTLVSWLKDEGIKTFELSPRDFGIERHGESAPEVKDAEESAKIALSLLGGDSKKSVLMDMVLVNSAAALVVAGKAGDLRNGVELARESIASGAAYRKLEELVRFSGGDTSRVEVYAKSK